MLQANKSAYAITQRGLDEGSDVDDLGEDDNGVVDLMEGVPCAVLSGCCRAVPRTPHSSLAL